jgi:LuxR family maltose regulon positive regulatory protein
LRGRDASEEPARSVTGGDRYLVDYLVEEVLERQSPRIQDFLLQTAILDRLCGSLCDALTEWHSTTGWRYWSSSNEPISS